LAEAVEGDEAQGPGSAAAWQADPGAETTDIQYGEEEHFSDDDTPGVEDVLCLESMELDGGIDPPVDGIDFRTHTTDFNSL